MFAIAAPKQPGMSEFRRIITADFTRAEQTARLFMEYGIRAAQRIAAEKGEHVCIEDALIRLIDLKRDDLGLPRDARITYKEGDVDRLWPGLRVQAAGYSAATAAFRNNS